MTNPGITGDYIHTYSADWWLIGCRIRRLPNRWNSTNIEQALNFK
jgi:hypothetical protein